MTLTRKSFGLSFDFWNTLYGNGDEPERHRLRVEYFHRIISNYIDVNNDTIEKVFRASTEFFIFEWQHNYRTPSAQERIQYMADLLSLTLRMEDIEKISRFFGEVIFDIPPQNNSENLTIIQQLADVYPMGIISDTGYISGKYIREFLKKEGIISCFQSLIFSDEREYGKPHISVFLQTCKNLNIPCSQLIHIGDLEQTDIQGAKNSGCIGIKYTGWNNNPTVNSQADQIVDNYKDLAQTIGEIVNR
jgi:HAD superfamily hydrolase (TIGR01549 family)